MAGCALSVLELTTIHLTAADSLRHTPVCCLPPLPPQPVLCPPFKQASSEASSLQQQLTALKARATETARQLSAARTAAKDAGEAQQREAQRAVAATAALGDLEAVLKRLEK